ncbi:MAG: 2,5-diamino-6-ribosylamino-4(3H)-pyrimidinone 5'-phosphate reductase [Thaumarchaeota archaeon]|jgi:2,5-diamino-6-(ribosylamino)-4(3H)-pyrimidinone 5'-phosphate reductase|nr:2,5-diamino-6-ribosylamino-4(3H)-pyrimidinone 5'-phosphate reductase [Nitrososphaerota archaeon]
MGRFRSYVIFSAAITLDGKLATRTGDSKLSSKADKNRVHRLRSKVDAILIGKNTAKLDDPVLSAHNAKKKNPIRIILDSNATIKNNSRILRTSSKIPTIIVVGERASKKNLQRLEKLPVQIIICGKDRINIKKLLISLRKQGIKKILVEGGGATNWAFVKEDLIDEAMITITPYLVGGINATTLVDGDGFSTITKSIKLKLKNVVKMKNEVVLHYEN